MPQTWVAEADSEVSSQPVMMDGDESEPRRGAMASLFLGTGFSMPFVLGVLTLIFGSPLEAFVIGGPWMFLTALLTVVTFSVTMVLQNRRDDWLGGYKVMPVGIIVIGCLGTVMGIRLCRQAAARLMSAGDAADLSWVIEVPGLASSGVHVALSVAVASFTLSGCACLLIALVIASRAPGSWGELTFSPRVMVITGLTVGVGTVFWLVSPLIRDYPTTGPEGVFLVFLSLCLFGLAAARIADGDPANESLWRARWGVVLVGFTGMTICLETESIFVSRSMFALVGMDGTPIERVANAKVFYDAIAGITGIHFITWTCVALGVAMVPLLGHGGIRVPFPRTYVVLPILLLLVRFGAPAVALTEWVKCAKLIIPGQEAAAVHQMLRVCVL